MIQKDLTTLKVNTATLKGDVHNITKQMDEMKTILLDSIKDADEKFAEKESVNKVEERLNTKASKSLVYVLIVGVFAMLSLLIGLISGGAIKIGEHII